MFYDPTEIPKLNYNRKSGRLQTQRPPEEDNLLGMIAVLMGYIDRKDPAFMEAISNDRDQSILKRFIDRNAIKPYQAKAIEIALEEQNIRDFKRFGEVFCHLYGNHQKEILDEAYQIQKNNNEHQYIGQILLELGLANMNQIVEVLKKQESDFSENNESLLAKIKLIEEELRPNFFVEFYATHKEASIILLAFFVFVVVSFAYLLF